MARWPQELALALALAGCDAKNEQSQACDPFDWSMRPVELRTILGVGRDASGTIYLADREDGESDRVFVSTDRELVRTGIEIELVDDDDPTGLRYLFTLETDPVVTLQILVPPAGPTRMGLVLGSDYDFFVIGEEGEELETLEADAISGMPVRDFAGEIELEYAVRTEDERLLVVVRPQEQSDYADFRLFFGPPDAVDERIVESFVRELDGGTTTIEFELDGATATAYLPAEQHGLPWTLTIADETTELTRRDTVPDGVAFHCLPG